MNFYGQLLVLEEELSKKYVTDANYLEATSLSFLTEEIVTF